MWLDALGLLVLGAFVLAGALRGALASAISLVSLVGAYGAAFLLAPGLGPPVARGLGSSALAGTLLAGSLVFVSVFVGVSLAGAALRRLEVRRRDGSPREAWDRLGGVCFGAARGALVVVLLAWLAHWVDALGTVRPGLPTDLTSGSSLAEVSERVVEAGVGGALGRDAAGAEVTARLLARPAQTVSGLRAVLEDPTLETLATDRIFWEQVETGALDQALSQPSFQRVARDADLRGRMAELGLVDAEAARSAERFETEARAGLAEVGPRLRALREDPEFARLATDPVVVRALERGEILSLLRHPGFQRVVARALSERSTL